MFEEPETLVHLFSDCEIVDGFWNDVFDWLSAKFQISINYSIQNKLFGFEENDYHFKFINGLLLCARFLIYRCRISKSKPNMIQYFNIVTSVKNSEYLIAKRKNKLEAHFRKWSDLS